MGVEGKPAKRHHVLVMRDNNSKQASWLCTDGMNHTQMQAAVGQWVMNSLRRFRLKCFETGTIPDIKFTPLVMNEEAMAALELDTWRCELEEMVKDVERSSQG